MTYHHQWRGQNIPTVKPNHITEIRISRKLLPKVYVGMEKQEAIFLLNFEKRDFILRGTILQVFPFCLKILSDQSVTPLIIHKSKVLAIDLIHPQIGSKVGAQEDKETWHGT